MSFFEELKRRNVFRVAIAYTITAWLVAQVLELLFDSFGTPDWVMKTIIVLMAFGLVFTVIFAWAYEMTPDGIKRESEVAREESIAPTTGKKLDKVIIGIMAVVIAFLLLDRFVLQKSGTELADDAQGVVQDAGDPRPPTNEDPIPSVAVLPFVNMSGNADNEYFSDGLTETLLHMLAQLPDLRVAARTSSFAFKGQNTSVTEIAGSLGVAHVLEGSVQRAGDRIRVTAQLIRAKDGFHVWSQNYDRTLEDIFAIQDEIATDVVNALDVSLLGNQAIVSVNTHDLTAYDRYLKALEQQAIYTYSSMAEAESLLKQSLAEDPEFIDAKLSLARNYTMMFGTGLIDQVEMRKKAMPLLEQVSSDQPGNRVARALTLTIELSESDESANANRQANIDELISLLAMLPTETFIRSIVAAWLDNFYNDQERALDLVNAGLLVDPLSAFLHSRKGELLMELGRLDDARLSMSRAIEIQPDYASAYSKMADIMSELGDLPATLDWTRKAVETDPQDHELASVLAIYFYELGMAEEGDRWADRVMALAPESDVARLTRLFGMLAHEDLKAAEATAISMIEDQVSGRQGAIWIAAFSFQRLVSNDNRDREGLEFLLRVRPDLEDYSTLPNDQQGTAMQWAAIMFAHRTLGPEVSQARWAKFSENVAATGAGWQEDDDFFGLMEPVLEGDLESAAKVALENGLNRPVAAWIGMNKAYDTPLFESLKMEPRVAARLAERDRELEREKRKVQAMLQRPEWQ